MRCLCGLLSIENIRQSALFTICSACCIQERRKMSKKIMRAVQAHHGVQSLLKMLEIPRLRLLAAKALTGLSRIEEVKQILTKILPAGNTVRQVVSLMYDDRLKRLVRIEKYNITRLMRDVINRIYNQTFQ